MVLSLPGPNTTTVIGVFYTVLTQISLSSEYAMVQQNTAWTRHTFYIYSSIIVFIYIIYIIIIYIITNISTYDITISSLEGRESVGLQMSWFITYNYFSPIDSASYAQWLNWRASPAPTHAAHVRFVLYCPVRDLSSVAE